MQPLVVIWRKVLRATKHGESDQGYRAVRDLLRQPDLCLTGRRYVGCSAPDRHLGAQKGQGRLGHGMFLLKPNSLRQIGCFGVLFDFPVPFLTVFFLFD